MHRHLFRAGGNHSQHTEHGKAADYGLLFIKFLFLRLGKFRNISGIRQHLTANKGKEESSDDADSDSKRRDREKAKRFISQFLHHTGRRCV